MIYLSIFVAVAVVIFRLFGATKDLIKDSQSFYFYNSVKL